MIWYILFLLLFLLLLSTCPFRGGVLSSPSRNVIITVFSHLFIDGFSRSLLANLACALVSDYSCIPSSLVIFNLLWRHESPSNLFDCAQISPEILCGLQLTRFVEADSGHSLLQFL